jgi:hypothetical protein
MELATHEAQGDESYVDGPEVEGRRGYLEEQIERNEEDER